MRSSRKSHYHSSTTAAEVQERELLQGSRNALWASSVRSKQDAVAFFKQHYPAFPETLCLALGDYIDRGVKGQIKLPEEYFKGKMPTTVPTSKWDPLEDIEKHRQEALINLTEKRLEQLMSNSEDFKKSNKK